MYLPFVQIHNITAVAKPTISSIQGTTIITTVHILHMSIPLSMPLTLTHLRQLFILLFTCPYIYRCTHYSKCSQPEPMWCYRHLCLLQLLSTPIHPWLCIICQSYVPLTGMLPLTIPLLTGMSPLTIQLFARMSPLTRLLQMLILLVPLIYAVVVCPSPCTSPRIDLRWRVW